MPTIYKVLGQSVTADQTINVTNKAIASNVVTLTTDVAHKIIVGQPVTLSEAAQVLNITNKALTSNVATLTTASNHRILVGQNVTVAGVDATFNGTYGVTAVTANTFSYAKINANIASTSATGTVTYSDLAFNGTYIVDSDPTATTFTYTTASADLASTAASSFTATSVPWVTVYECPALTSTVVSNITICNQTELPTKYSIAISDSLSLGNENILFWNDTLDSFDTIQITGGIVLDETVKYLLVGADLENVSINVFGSEVTA